MRMVHLASVLGLCGALAFGTPEAQAGKKKGYGKVKHYGGVVGLPPGHGGIPPGQAKKLFGPIPGYAPSVLVAPATAYGYPTYPGPAPIDYGGNAPALYPAGPIAPLAQPPIGYVPVYP